MKENTNVPVGVNAIEIHPMPDSVDGSRRHTSTDTSYHTKKSKAEGMMDISLLTANANQLKFILYYNQQSKTFYAALFLIVLSLVLQVIVGLLLIFRVSWIEVAELNWIT